MNMKKKLVKVLQTTYCNKCKHEFNRKKFKCPVCGHNHRSEPRIEISTPTLAKTGKKYWTI